MWVRGSILFALALLAPFACTTSKGELVVSVQTDMDLPKDIDEIYLEVSAHGMVYLGSQYRVGKGEQQIPATMGVLAGANPADPVRIRLMGRKAGHIRVLREVVTTVPGDRIATLRMPIQWLCDGQATEDPANPNTSAASTCPDGQTCIAGSCQPAKVESAKLPDYDPTQIFGGASAPGSGGECLDTVGCFASGAAAPVDMATCSIPKPAGGMGINVALVQGPDGAGICGPGACLLPLDANATDGTGWIGTPDGRILLPPAACDRMAKGLIGSVAVTTACHTKTQAIPTCGPWSSAGSTEGTADAGAPADVVLPGDAGGALVGNVSGSAAGIAFSAKDGFAATGLTMPPGVGSSIAARQLLLIGLSDQGGVCNALTAHPNYIRQNSTELGVTIVGADNITPIGKGTYPLYGGYVGAAPPPSVTSSFAMVEILHVDSQCAYTPLGGWSLAASGSVTIESVSGTLVSGSFSATFPTGMIGGSFSVPTCALDLANVFNGGGDGGPPPYPVSGPADASPPGYYDGSMGPPPYDGGPGPYDASLGPGPGPYYDASVGPYPGPDGGAFPYLPGFCAANVGSGSMYPPPFDGGYPLPFDGSFPPYFDGGYPPPYDGSYPPPYDGGPPPNPDAGPGPSPDVCIDGVWLFPPGATGGNGPISATVSGTYPNYFVTFNFAPDAGPPDGGNPYVNIPAMFDQSSQPPGLRFQTQILNQGQVCMPSPNVLMAQMGLQGPITGSCPPNGFFVGNISNCLSCGGEGGMGGNCQGCGNLSCPIGFPTTKQAPQ
jgi:hypothetical protein